MASSTIKAVYNSLIAGETIEIVFNSLEQRKDFSIELARYKKEQEDIMIACMLMDLDDVKQVFYERMDSGPDMQFFKYRIFLQKRNRFINVSFSIIKSSESSETTPSNE